MKLPARFPLHYRAPLVQVMERGAAPGMRDVMQDTASGSELARVRLFSFTSQQQGVVWTTRRQGPPEYFPMADWDDRRWYWLLKHRNGREDYKPLCLVYLPLGTEHRALADFCRAVTARRMKG